MQLAIKIVVHLKLSWMHQSEKDSSFQLRIINFITNKSLQLKSYFFIQSVEDLYLLKSFYFHDYSDHEHAHSKIHTHKKKLAPPEKKFPFYKF